MEQPKTTLAKTSPTQTPPAAGSLPKGFQYSGVACGIKPSGKKDLALIVADNDAVAAGLYTQNIVRAASIGWNEAITPSDQFRAIVINSGNANACTGLEGEQNNRSMADQVADHLGCTADQVCVLSTGVIGVQLPMQNVSQGIEAAWQHLGITASHFDAAAEAITTTDQWTKSTGTTYESSGGTVNIAAMAKGAGMIGPKMATMLAIIQTDAALTPEVAHEVLKNANAKSFNCISVEGHMSTNDAVVLIASGESGVAISDQAQQQQLTQRLTDVCIDLAKQIPADGEGASHLIEIFVQGAATDADADRIARSVANSALVKTAIAGHDPNWGRIVSAVGYAPASIDADQISLKLNSYRLFENGEPVDFDAAAVSQSIADNSETHIEISVGSGPGQATHWTSDLTVEYVRFNSEYTT